MATTQNQGGRSAPPRPAQRPSQNLPAPQQTKTGELNFKKLLASYDKQIAAALPRHMSADRMMRVALTAYNQTPDLQKSDPITVMAAVIQASQLGLEPGINVLGHAYLVPFRNYGRAKKENGSPLIQYDYNNNKFILEAQLMVGYKGYLELARRSGRCKQFGANIVYSYDSFSLEYRPEPILDHKPRLMRAGQGGVLIPCSPEERGEIIGVYGYVQTKDGDLNVEFLSIHDLEDIRDRFSQSGKADEKHPDGKGVWFEHFPVMCRKTGVRGVSKWAPLSPELQTASSLDEAADNGMSQQLAEALDLVPTGTERGYVYVAGEENGNGGNGNGNGAPENGGGSQPDPQQKDATQPAQTATAGAPAGAPAAKDAPKPQQQQPQPPEDPGRGLTADDFTAEDWQELQANLRAAGMNRPAIMQWLGTQGDTRAAMQRAETLRFESEQAQ